MYTPLYSDRGAGSTLFMKYKVFVDGQEGTTGLEISERLAGRKELELLKISSDLRKDPSERQRLINMSDISFLCLPDFAALESASLVQADNIRTCIIDASTAHRTVEGWVYGIPELSPTRRKEIEKARRIAVPGCHASGFIIPIAPLVEAGIISKTLALSFTSLTGYSGGGKQLISWYEQENYTGPSLNSPRLYALGLQHKHLPELSYHTGLEKTPLFSPILSNIYKGMLVSTPLHIGELNGIGHAREIHAFLEEKYRGEHFVRVQPFGGEGVLELNSYLEATACNNSNSLEIFVFGHETQALIVSRLDNLGKGASGAAVQCMNIRLGLDEKQGL